MREIADSSRMIEVRRAGSIYSQTENADMVYVILSGMAALDDER